MLSRGEWSLSARWHYRDRLSVTPAAGAGAGAGAGSWGAGLPCARGCHVLGTRQAPRPAAGSVGVQGKGEAFTI